MGHVNSVCVVILAAAVAISFHKRLLRDLAAAVSGAIDNFRGGPPTPMHPSPARDDRLLRRPSRKVAA